jgi:hypothetical protein
MRQLDTICPGSMLMKCAQNILHTALWKYYIRLKPRIMYLIKFLTLLPFECDAWKLTVIFPQYVRNFLLRLHNGMTMLGHEIHCYFTYHIWRRQCFIHNTWIHTSLMATGTSEPYHLHCFKYVFGSETNFYWHRRKYKTRKSLSVLAQYTTTKSVSSVKISGKLICRL